MLERIRHMIAKEFIQAFRDPRMVAVIFVVPVVQLLIFGYAVTTDVRNISTIVCDLDNSVESRAFVSRFAHSGYFDIIEYIDNEQRIANVLDHSKAQVVLQINKGFGQDLLSGRTAKMQLLIDGTDSNTAGIVLSYSQKIGEDFSSEVFRSRLSRQGFTLQKPPGIELQTRSWFNENLESRTFYVPGLIAVQVMIITLILTSMAVVREKEIGTMEQVMVTPISPLEFILGKTIPFALIGMIDVVLISVVGIFWFAIPMRGNLLILFLCTVLYLMTVLGVGLLISTVSQTQQQAMMTTFFFGMPAILLSGFMFPIANMPEIVQWLTYLDPLRFFIIILRGLFLKGIGLNILWPQIIALAIFGPVTFWMASLKLKRTFR